MNDAKLRLIRTQERDATLRAVALSFRRMSIWKRLKLVFFARWI